MVAPTQPIDFSSSQAVIPQNREEAVLVDQGNDSSQSVVTEARPSLPQSRPLSRNAGIVLLADAKVPGTSPVQSAVEAPVSNQLELVTNNTKNIAPLTGTVKVSDPSKLTIEQFKNTILDANSYPLTGTFWGNHVLVESKSLGTKNGYTIVYQRTGGGAGVWSRHYVIAMKVDSQDANKIVIKWDLVKIPVLADGSFGGPYAADLNRNRSNTVFTPYNSGSWTYDTKEGTITYSLTNDSGGNLPGFLKSKGALLTFPQELLKKKFGITGDIK